eukprot:gene17982-21470_t
MPLTVKGPRKASTRHLITLLSGALPILLGVLILYWQAGRTLEHSTAQTAQEAVRQFDLMLDNTALAAQDLLPLAGHECDNPTQLKLREQVTRRPFVRATTLSWQRNIYCSSLFGGNYQSPVNPEDYVGGRLWLMKGNPVTPDTALLVYRLTEGDRGAFASIDGYHLTNALRLISRYTDLVLQVGPNWLAADGKVHSTALPTFSVAHHHLDSTRYTYSVEAGMPEGETWRYMRARYPALFVLVVFFGVLAGILAHWLQKRSSILSRLAEFRAAEKALQEQLAQLESLKNDAGLKKEIEFEEKLQGLMKTYGKSLRDIISILDPNPGKSGASVAAAPKQRRARVVKVYHNPHTGELIETKGGNHRGLKAWKEQKALHMQGFFVYRHR